MMRKNHSSLKLLNEFEERKGVYIINIDTAEREFVPFENPKAISQTAVSSLCTQIRMAIAVQSISYGEFKQKFPQINQYLNKMKLMGYRTL